MIVDLQSYLTNSNISLDKFYKIETYYDHRICLAGIIMALTFGGKWKIHDPDSIQTSFPTFLNIVKTFDLWKYMELNDLKIKNKIGLSFQEDFLLINR